MHNVKEKIGHMYFTCISQEFNFLANFFLKLFLENP